MGRIHLDHSSLSSSSFMKSSFLIQMTRIEFFIFLIAWGIFFEWWELDLQLLPSSSSLLMSRAESNYFLLAYILCMNPTILGGHSRWLSPLLQSPLLLLLLQVVMHSRSSHSSTVFSKPSFDLCSYIKIGLSRNQTCSVSFGNTLVIQVDPWLNQQWFSWPWSSSPLYSCRCPIHFIQRDQILPCLEFVNFTNLMIKLMW